MFKNKKFEVKVLDDKPKYNRGEEITNVEDRLSLAKPRFDAVDIQMTAERFAREAARAYLIIKGFKTLCGMAEHLVVTKVK